ncbi:MAG TPA: sialidase family protein [Candidatus Dormibacteraeota bacterium]
MRRILVAALAGLLAAALAPAGGAGASLLPEPLLSGVQGALPRPALPALPGLTPQLPALTLPAGLGAAAPGGRQRQSLSSALALGLPGLDAVGGGGDDAGVRDAFPGTGVPRPPANLSPDVLVNQDRSAMPHNETSVAINPRNPQNLVVGANDYSLGFGSSGFYASFDGGQSFFGGVLPMPSVVFTPPVPALPSPVPPVAKTAIALDGGGDPAVAFDRDGVAYYAEINFHRTGCVSGIFVLRSSNGGQTWSRPLSGQPQPGDTRRSGDGVVAVNANDNDCQIFYDKEYIATGPRPAGVPADPQADRAHLSSDRLYIVYSEFSQVPPLAVQPYAGPALGLGSPTFMAYSDDQGRHWSTPVYVNGASHALCSSGGLGNVSLPSPLPSLQAPLSVGLPPAPPGLDMCVDSQGAVPAVDPRSGAVHVTFANGDNPACPNGQVLVVSSTDGGVTWTREPGQAACLVVPLPQAGDQACPQEPAGQEILSGYCFRVPSATQQSVTVNPLDGSVHVVYQDNRNGGKDWDAGKPGAKPSDIDIFATASRDGGRTWAPAVRVNQDPLGDHRDQFFPWSAYGPDGTLYVSYLDRSPDPTGRLIGRSLAVSHDGGATFSARAVSSGLFDGNLGFRKGSFLGDYTGIAAGALGSYTTWPDTRRAGVVVKGDNPTDLWSDIVGYASAAGSAGPRPRSLPAAGVTGSGGVVPAPRPAAEDAPTTTYGPDPAAASPAAPARPLAAAVPAPSRIADVLGGFLCGLVVMGASSLGARRRRRGRG